MLATNSPVITNQIASSEKKMLNRLGQLALYSENFASANDHVLKNFFFSFNKNIYKSVDISIFSRRFMQCR